MRKLSIFVLFAMIALLVFGASAQDEETFTLTILHTNDTHAHHEPNSDGDGGPARQATVQKQIMEEGGNVILLDGGDRFTGTLFHTQFLGQDQVQIMNALGYDAMSLGNHEFDNGDEVLAAFIEGIEFPALAANVDASGSELLSDLIEDFAILEVGGEQIAVIGLVTADTTFSSSPGDELEFTYDYVNVVNALTEALMADGINKIIVLTHTGINVDLEIIPQLQGVDVYVGGHSHTLLSNAYTDGSREYPILIETEEGGQTFYVQAGQYNTFLGRLDVEFDADGNIVEAEGDTILLSRYIEPDAEVQAIVDELASEIEEIRNTEVGATATELIFGDRIMCRVEECPLGNIIADGIRAETGADIAFMNGGGIRANIEEGPITLGDVLTVHPFGNQIATFELSGADVIDALENGVSLLNLTEDGANVSRDGLAGRFLQVSGITYSIDVTQEAGSRISNVLVLNDAGEFEPIDPEATYSIATLNFLRGGGDGFTVFAENAINPYDFGRLDYEVTAEYLALLEEVSPFLEGRITYINAEPVPMESE